jgi:hypothetical protein
LEKYGGLAERNSTLGFVLKNLYRSSLLLLKPGLKTIFDYAIPRGKAIRLH